MKVRWSAPAKADRNLIYDYIEQDSPLSAANVDERIWNAVQFLAQFPLAGRLGRVPGTRERPVDRTPYVIAYRIDRGALRVLRVLHGAQRWPSTLADR